MKNLFLLALLLLLSTTGFANVLNIEHWGLDNMQSTNNVARTVTTANHQLYFTVGRNGNSGSESFNWTATLNGTLIGSATQPIASGIYALDVTISNDQVLAVGTNTLVVHIVDNDKPSQDSQESYTITYTPSPLPVTLTSFSGRLVAGKVLLGWGTAQEQGFSHFVVEKSATGSEYTAVGKVNATGTGSTYRFELPATADAYYRLSIVDADGSTKFSPVVFVSVRTVVVSTTCYNTQGQVLPTDAPKHGLVITVEISSDGTRKSRKEVYE